MYNNFLNTGYAGTLFSQSMAGFFQESANAILDNRHRQEIVSKARVLLTRVPLAKAIIDILTRGVIGSGLHLSEKDVLWDALSSLYSFDAEGSKDLYQLQQLAFMTMLSSGECFLLRQRKADDEYSKWFCIEPDHVFTPPYMSPNTSGIYIYRGHTIVDGIEFNTDGTPRAIWYCANPYAVDIMNKKAWERIFFYDKEGNPNVIHLRLQDRPEYPRGLPIIAPLIENLYSLYAYQQAQIQMGILQSCQALVIKTRTDKTINPLNGLSNIDLDAPLYPDAEKAEDKPKTEYSIVPPASAAFDGSINNINFVSAGQTVHLAPDESLECISPTGPSNSLTEYYNLVVEQCGACLGIPKAILTGVFDTSFSSSKASISQWLYTISKHRKVFIEQLLKPLYRVYLSEAGASDTDALTRAAASAWVLRDPPMLTDEVRTAAYYETGLKYGLITRDEMAHQLFGHAAAVSDADFSATPMNPDNAEIS